MKSIFSWRSKSIDVEEDESMKLTKVELVKKTPSSSNMSAFKLIFLGCSESGKTTIVKQILNYVNPSTQFYTAFTHDIYENLINGTMKCIEHAEETKQVIDNIFTHVSAHLFNFTG